MRFRHTLVAGAVLLTCALFAPQVFSQHEGHDEHQPQMSEEEAKMWMAFQQAGTPGEHHKHLEPLVGTWKVHTRYRMSPDAEWGESEGTGKFEWIMGGRYLLEDIETSMEEMPTPFKGMGIIGYDNVRKKHVSIWIDNMSTAFYISEGTCDDSGKTLTYHGEVTDPLTGRTKKEKQVHRIINDEKHVFQVFARDDDGKEYMSLEVTYTR